MFIPALLMIVNTRNQQICPANGEWVKKFQYVPTWNVIQQCKDINFQGRGRHGREFHVYFSVKEANLKRLD